MDKSEVHSLVLSYRYIKGQRWLYGVNEHVVYEVNDLLDSIDTAKQKFLEPYVQEFLEGLADMTRKLLLTPTYISSTPSSRASSRGSDDTQPRPYMKNESQVSHSNRSSLLNSLIASLAVTRPGSAVTRPGSAEIYQPESPVERRISWVKREIRRFQDAVNNNIRYLPYEPQSEPERQRSHAQERQRSRSSSRESSRESSRDDDGMDSSEPPVTPRRRRGSGSRMHVIDNLYGDEPNEYSDPPVTPRRQPVTPFISRVLIPQSMPPIHAGVPDEGLIPQIMPDINAGIIHEGNQSNRNNNNVPDDPALNLETVPPPRTTRRYRPPQQRERIPVNTGMAAPPIVNRNRNANASEHIREFPTQAFPNTNSAVPRPNIRSIVADARNDVSELANNPESSTNQARRPSSRGLQPLRGGVSSNRKTQTARKRRRRNRKTKSKK